MTIRNGIPWGGCLNSSQWTGISANCELIWLASPLFDHIRSTSISMGNSNHMQGFLILRRAVVPGEELRWKYSTAQAYRNDPAPPSPTAVLPSPIYPHKRSASTAAAAALSVTQNKRQANSEPSTFAAVVATNAAKTAAPKHPAVSHQCPHHTTCNPGKCSDCQCLECVQNQPGSKRVIKLRAFL